MESMLIREQYKVVHVLAAQENYAAMEAVDIQNRENNTYLLNVYEGELLKPYLRTFHELRGCSAFHEMFVWHGSLVAVFRCRQGTNIDQVFYKGTQVDWQTRLTVARALFHQALSAWEYPSRVSCATLLSVNLALVMEECPLAVNYMIPPLEEMDRRELVLLLSDQIKKVLIHRWDSPMEERRFVRELCSGEETSAVRAYGRWVAEEPVIRAAYEKMNGMNRLSRWLHLLGVNLHDWLQIRMKQQREGGDRQ